MDEPIELAAGHQGFIFQFNGRERQLPMQQYHTHRELELNVVTSGMATYLLPGRRYTIDSGSLLWLFPKQPHLLTEWSDNFQMYVVVFRPELVAKHCAEGARTVLQKLDPPGYFCRHATPPSIALLDALSQSLCEGNPAESPLTWAGLAYGRKENKPYVHEKPEILNAGLGYLLLLAWDVFAKAEEQNRFQQLHPAVERAVAVLSSEGELAEAPLAEVAKHCGLSPSRLSRLFKAQTGGSMVQFRNHKRLERFVQIYNRGPQLTLTEAAYDAGFGSYPQFQKVFRQFFGYGPLEYRRKKAGQLGNA